ncbi:hypothetical protein KKF84_10405 [Myxococcota bacterium]|nr:hypothetical protein [Myxococcota bacterium]
MYYFSSDRIRNEANKHLASEPHIRIQILTIPYRAGQKLFDEYHGELLIQILDGSAILQTLNEERALVPGDQVLLEDGEGFVLRPSEKEKTVKAQFIWAPGLNPCKICWENYGKFYEKE